MVKSALNKLKNSKMPYDSLVYIKEGDKVPTLGEVRGKVIILDNEGQGTYTKYEDHYDVDPTTKENYLNSVLHSGCSQNINATGRSFCAESQLNNETVFGEPTVKYVFSSCVKLGSGWTPSSAANKVNPWLENALDNMNTGKRIGWVMMDFPTDSLISKVIRSNSVNAFTNNTNSAPTTIESAYNERTEIIKTGPRGGLFHEPGQGTNIIDDIVNSL